MATDAAARYIVPLTCLILITLFFIQRYGTSVIGRMFGPVMVVWFISLGVLGLRAIAQQPDILAAMNPIHAYRFFSINHLHGIVSLASVVLCITGCEALYADMGHFGRFPIRVTWYCIVLPGLLLNYFGQCALLLHDPNIANVNPFYALAPAPLLYPLVGLATVATIIASQAMISGVYSLTQQAIQLGFTPRMRIVHTSEHAKGQIYMPTVNWMLMIACLTLVLVFKESSRLAAAYGFAVTGTMIITSLLFFQVSRYKWNWPLWRSSLLLAVFLFFDIAFLGANMLKVVDGGWITICIATFIATSMIDIYSTSFFLGRETMFATGSSPMSQWRKHLFIFMSRNAWNATSFFGLPPDRVVELGNQVEL